MALNDGISELEKPKVALLNNPKVRGGIIQALLLIFILWLVWSMGSNAAFNLEKAGIASGFGFLDRTAGFGINFSPFIEYAETSNYMTVFWVGLQNTLILAFVGIILATILGFIVGIARLSNNWVINKMAYVYVEGLRNIPLLLQIFIWYKGVLALLPNARNSIDLGPLGQLNIKAWSMPKAIFSEGASLILWGILAAIVLWYIIARWSKKRQMETGQTFPTFLTGLGLLIGLPLIAYFIAGQPLEFEFPKPGNFGPKGGAKIPPEFTALLISLVVYTAAFIAEIVRAGILAVNNGQSEAAHALGLRQGPTLRLVVIPQALRVIIPPLTSQYLNLTKNSSLAVAIAYPDLTSVFAGTALNQTGQAVEILLMTMLTYLLISLITSLFMNWYNAKMSLEER